MRIADVTAGIVFEYQVSTNGVGEVPEAGAKLLYSVVWTFNETNCNLIAQPPTIPNE